MQQMSAGPPRPPLLLCIALDLQTGRGIGALEKNQGVLFACPSVRPPASPFARSPPRSPNISCHLYHDASVVRILIERLKQRCTSIKKKYCNFTPARRARNFIGESRSRDEAVLPILSCKISPPYTAVAEHVPPCLPPHLNSRQWTNPINQSSS